MGRPRRRHGRGGGAPFTGEPNGLQPGDDVGNRRSFKQAQLPPEDIGNRRPPDEDLWVPDDDLGNRVDIAPTHEISGVLAEIDGRRRRKRKGQPQQRIGRYIVGGVNPVVAGNVQRTVEAMKEADDRQRAERAAFVATGPGAGGATFAGPPSPPRDNGAALDDERGGRGRRRRRRRRDGREQVDGVAAQEVSERRAQRFFDFEEDDRFEYVLKSDPEQKRKDAHHAVQSVLDGAGRDATVRSRVLSDDDKPKVIVTIDERGPAASLPPERQSESAREALFVLGNAALMSLNYLANKIVNRYPDDRIRLAILPAADEGLYLESLAEHRRLKRVADAPPPANGASGKPEPSSAAAAPFVEPPPALAVDESLAADATDAGFASDEPPAVVQPIEAPVEADAEAEADAEPASLAADEIPGREATKKRGSAKKAGGARKATAKVGAKTAAAKKSTVKKAAVKRAAVKKKTSSSEE